MPLPNSARKRPELLLGAAALLVAAGVLLFMAARNNAAQELAPAPTTAYLHGVNPFEYFEQPHPHQPEQYLSAEGEDHPGEDRPPESYIVSYTGYTLYENRTGAASPANPTNNANQPQHTLPPVQHTLPGIQHTQPAAQHTQADTQRPQPGAQHTQSPVQYSQPPVPQQPVQQQPAAPGLVNLNTATQAQLETLPGIGPVKAQAILEWRNRNGRFTDPGQLLEVTGIGEKTLMNMLPYVTI